MASKTDRILSYLPPVFSALPRPTALYAVADAFGGQLQEAENSLGAVMLSHWVDYADRGAPFIADLACIASLYGLAPRNAAHDVAQFPAACCQPVSADETVEEFREHLKRYVRTFLEGTVTVQGILRITAEALGLHIEDDYASINTWWTRDSDSLTATVSRADSAARLLLGAEFSSARGSSATSAAVTGKPSFTKGIDLKGARFLRVRVDGKPSPDIDLGSLGATPALSDVVAIINTTLSEAIASDAGGHLRLASPTHGAQSRLDVVDVRTDAAPVLLGLLPRTYTGKASTAATVTGKPDLSKGVDLRRRWQLRLSIDRASAITADCRGKSPEGTGLAEIVDAINKAAGARIARHDGRHAILTSPTAGPAGSIEFLSAGSEDASAPIFGIGPRNFSGADAMAARIDGCADLSTGADLRAQHLLQISVDGAQPVVVDLWDAVTDLASASPATIASAINRALGARIAGDDGRTLSLTSTLNGLASQIECGPVTERLTRRFISQAYITDEAAPVIFGFLRRRAAGTPASAARLTGAVNLSGGVDLRKDHFLGIAVDDLPLKEIDVSAGIPVPRGATLPEIVGAINAAMHADLASDDGTHLILTSPSVGPASRIALEPVKTGDARLVLFGASPAAATGEGPGAAMIRGDMDLRKPVNLADRHTLRLAVDGAAPVDIDVAGAAPQATWLDEIVQQVNRAVPGVASATADDRLLLTSPSAGGSSSLELLPLRALEVIEYPPAAVDEPARQTQHGDQWIVSNDGAGDSEAQFDIFAPHGDTGVQLIDRGAGTRVRVLDPILPGETMHIRRGCDTGLEVDITDTNGIARAVPRSAVIAGTLADQALIPFEGQRTLSRGEGASEPPTLQLNDPEAPAVLVVRAVAAMRPGDSVSVNVSPAHAVPAKNAAADAAHAGRLHASGREFFLLDESGKEIFRVLPGAAQPRAHRHEPVVLVGGAVYTETHALPVLVADSIVTLFDVTFRLRRAGRRGTDRDLRRSQHWSGRYAREPSSCAPHPALKTRPRGGTGQSRPARPPARNLGAYIYEQSLVAFRPGQVRLHTTRQQESSGAGGRGSFHRGNVERVGHIRL